MMEGDTTCIICNTVAALNKTPVTERTHYYNTKGKLERQLCPEMITLGNIEERRALLDKTRICPACLTQSIDASSHKGEPCNILTDTVMRFLKCMHPSCKIRSVLCVEHKAENMTLLQDEAERTRRFNISLCFLSINEGLRTMSLFTTGCNQTTLEATRTEPTTVWDQQPRQHLYNTVNELCLSLIHI